MLERPGSDGIFQSIHGTYASLISLLATPDEVYQWQLSNQPPKSTVTDMWSLLCLTLSEIKNPFFQKLPRFWSQKPDSIIIVNRICAKNELQQTSQQ